MEIFGFMTAVLGSVIFWIAYAMVSFFITILIGKSDKLEMFDSSDLKTLVAYQEWFPEYVGWSLFGFIITYVFWPIILLFCIVLYAFRLLVGMSLYTLSFAIRSVDPKIPVVKISFNKKD